MPSLKKLGSKISTIFLVLSLPVALVLSNYHAGKTTVQSKNNARARSGARSSCAARTRKPPQDAKMSCFCGLPARTFETQEVESLTARSRKKLKIQPQEAARTYESYREPQESGRSCCRSHCPFDNIKCCVGGRNAPHSLSVLSII